MCKSKAACHECLNRSQLRPKQFQESIRDPRKHSRRLTDLKPEWSALQNSINGIRALTQLLPSKNARYLRSIQSPKHRRFVLVDAEQLRAICAMTLDLGNSQWPQGILPGLQLLFWKNLRWQQMPALKEVNGDIKAGSELRLTGLNTYKVHVSLILSLVYVNQRTEKDSLPYFFLRRKLFTSVNNESLWHLLLLF